MYTIYVIIYLNHAQSQAPLKPVSFQETKFGITADLRQADSNISALAAVDAKPTVSVGIRIQTFY